jgi:hypothetical protein|tara:strand:- start:240 stop:485 length:246 start_codon:yes stop_codon:yes gene_type:complete
MVDNMNWKFRIVKSNDGVDDKFSIEECLLCEDNTLQSHTIEFSPKCNSIEELRNTFNEMLECEEYSSQKYGGWKRNNHPPM